MTKGLLEVDVISAKDLKYDQNLALGKCAEH